jgi:hypothetical protein
MKTTIISTSYLIILSRTKYVLRSIIAVFVSDHIVMNDRLLTFEEGEQGYVDSPVLLSIDIHKNV